MATRIAGIVITLSTGAPVNGATVTPRASDGSTGTTGVTNSAGFIAIAGLSDKNWIGTVANSAQVFTPVTFAEQMIVDDLHGQRNTLNAHDISQLRGKLTVNQVNSDTASSGQVITADGLGTASWQTGGGGSSNSFATIAVSGQSDVVADSSTDILTLVAGTNMTITTNAGTDTITFEAAGGGGSDPGYKRHFLTMGG